MAPRRAEREPERDLFLAVESPSQQKAREIDAGQKQHQTDNAREDPRCRLDERIRGRKKDNVGRRDEEERGLRVPVLDVVVAKPRGDGARGRLRLHEAHAGPFAGFDENRVAPAGLKLVISARHELIDHHPRCEDSRHDTPEVTGIGFGSHTDNGVSKPADTKGLPHDTGVAAIGVLPIAVAEHDHRVSAGRDIVFGQEQPAELRLDTKCPEIVAGHGLARDHLDALGVIELHDEEPRAGDLREHFGGTFLEVLVVGPREDAVLEIGARQVDLDQLLGPFERNLPDQDSVDEAENGRIGPNSESERQDRDRSKARRLRQSPASIANVLE